MSVLIKNMEMPTSCDDCEFCKRAIGYDWCCIPMGKGRSKPLDEPVIKPDWCPLVPVPPHGRLIDADALMEQVERDTPLSAVFEKTMRRYLNTAPTIVPAEEAASHDCT